MPRPTKAEHQALMQLCADRDTNGQIVCVSGSQHRDEHPCRGEVLLHHKNNNPNDGSPENLENLCRGHNARTDPRGPQTVDKWTSWKNLKHSITERRNRKPFEMVKAEKADDYFRDFVKEFFQTNTEVKVDDLIDAAKEGIYKAKKISVAQKTLFNVYRSMRNPINGSLVEFGKKPPSDSEDEDSGKEEAWAKLRSPK